MQRPDTDTDTGTDTGTDGGGTPRLLSIDVRQTYDLRSRVLRAGMASSTVEFAEDSDPSTQHVGVDLGGEIVAIATWIDRPSPDAPDLKGMQLRGMATDPAPHVRGRGLGSMLLRKGIEIAVEDRADVVWANARDDALGFYLAHDFQVSSDGFITPDTGLRHHRILLHLH